MPDAPGRKRRKLNPRQLAIAAAYTTPGPTMGKLTATAQAVLPHMSKTVGKVTVWRTLQHEDVRAVVEEAIEQYGAGIGWRIKTLRDYASPDNILTEERESIGPDGQRTITKVRKPTSPGDAIRAVDVLNKMSGVYDEQHAASLVTARFQTLAGRFHALMSNVTPEEIENVPHENLERKPMRPRRHVAQYMVGMLPCRVLPRTLYPQMPPSARGEPTVDAASATHDVAWLGT